MKKIVCLGGAVGTSTVLAGLKKYNFKLTAIYPTTDDGGSTGRLIKDYDILPVGDLRRLVAVLGKKNTITDLLLYRFSKGELKGHALGSIMITALINIYGNIENATGELKKLLDIKHDILPISLKKSVLCAKLENNQLVRGENKIDEVIGFDGNLSIKKLFLNPPVKINPKVKKAILDADLIILGPGDLHTSILPNLLIGNVKEAIKQSKAKKIYVCNLMTKFGQTNSFKVSDFVSEMEKYLGKNILDCIIYNNKKPSNEILKYHQKIKSNFVEIDPENFNKKYIYLKNNLIQNKLHQKKPGDALQRSLIKHNPSILAKLILSCL